TADRIWEDALHRTLTNIFFFFEMPPFIAVPFLAALLLFYVLLPPYYLGKWLVSLAASTLRFLCAMRI
ncbi:MAG: hypothetical protein GX580_13070, partial [Candidatus Hydrogenedens sp.]|nr:hypothetical protein [Candidatus Hydrogenedens sp.]